MWLLGDIILYRFSETQERYPFPLSSMNSSHVCLKALRSSPRPKAKARRNFFVGGGKETNIHRGKSVSIKFPNDTLEFGIGIVHTSE